MIEEETSNGKFTGQSSMRRTPLNYQLEEKDSETMILQPTPGSRNTTVTKMASNFAYLSQQVTKTSKKGAGHNKSSGSKHLELQKALKAQADKRAAEKRKSTVSSSAVKDFQERQEAQIQQKRDKLQKMKTENEIQMQEECSFSPKGVNKVKQ